MKIVYDVHTGGNTKYASLDKLDRERVLKRLTINFYKMLEEAAFDEQKEKMLNHADADFRTNQTGQTNTMRSFLAGILHQHSIKERDFSVWQLKGITLASQVFDEYYRSGAIEFEKGKIKTDAKTLIDNHPSGLFSRAH